MDMYFEYTYLENDIHYFKWLSRSAESNSEYYDCIKQIYDSLPEDTEVVRILHDYQHLAYAPLENIVPKIKSLQSQYPNLNRKIAYLSTDELTATLLKSVTNATNRTGTRKFFKPSEKHQAIQWLVAMS